MANHLDACIATFGDRSRYEGAQRYLDRLRAKVEEFPEGHVLAWLGEQCIGQLELEVPYGLLRGYVDLFYVTPGFRRRGYGRLLNEFAENYFRSWDAEHIELDVSRANTSAQAFYRAMGYHVHRAEGARFWRMAKHMPLPSNDANAVRIGLPP